VNTLSLTSNINRVLIKEHFHRTYKKIKCLNNKEVKRYNISYITKKCSVIIHVDSYNYTIKALLICSLIR